MAEWFMPYGVGPPELILQQRQIGYPQWGEYDRFTFDPSVYEITLRMWWDEEQETGSRILYDGALKTYPLGYRFRAEVGWRELRSHVFTFWLKQAHNWLLGTQPGEERRLIFIPHNDCSDIAYEVIVENPWDYDYAFKQRWIGFGGAFRVRGVKRVTQVPWATVQMIQSSQGQHSHWGAQYFGSSAGLPADNYNSYWDAYQIGIFYPDDNTVLLLRMNRGHGPKVYDRSVNRNNGAITGAEWLSSLRTWDGIPMTGVDGDGIRFDGTDDKITVAHTSSLLILGSGEDGTIDGWFRRDGAPAADETLVCKGSTAGFALKVKATTGLAEFTLQDDATPTPHTVTVTSTTNVCDGEWHHIRAERDAGATVKIYVDGTQEDSKSDTTGDCSNALGLLIGCLTGGSEYYGGDADEIRISDALRTSFTD